MSNMSGRCSRRAPLVAAVSFVLLAPWLAPCPARGADLYVAGTIGEVYKGEVRRDERTVGPVQERTDQPVVPPNRQPIFIRKTPTIEAVAAGCVVLESVDEAISVPIDRTAFP